jgi:predicted permease
MFSKWLDWLAQDAAYAARILAKNRGFTAIAVLSLALGIGANTAIFSLVDNILLKSLPVREPKQLAILARNPSRPSTSFNYPDYLYVRDHNRSYEGLIAYSTGGFPLGMTVPSEGEQAEPQLVFHSMVTGNYFEVLGVKPVIGRLFNDEDNRKPGAHPYAVLSYNLWRNRFGGDPRVIGKSIRLNGAPFTIIGVAAAGFAGTSVGTKPDLFLPVMMQGQVNPEFSDWNTRHFWWLDTLGRLKPGVSSDQARAELDVLLGQIEANDPEHRPTPAYDTEAAMRRKAVVLPGGQGFSYFRNEVSKPLIVLMIVVGSVLLIACANVANLLLARAAGRRREIAIRLAIGAGRMRLVSQLLVEGLLVGVAGGAAGLLFAQWGARVLIRLMPSQLFPPQIDTSIDWRLLAFACAVSLVTGIACGLAPALQATRPELTTALKAEAGSSGTGPRIGRFDLRRTLVVGQVALALLLVIGAGLFVRTLQNLKNVDAGFARENVLLVRIDPAQTGYTGQRTRQFYDRLVDRIEATPNVRSASTAEIIPLGGMRWNGGLAIQGYDWKPDEKPYLDFNAVGPRFFETMGIPILLGRDFRPEDNPAVVEDKERKDEDPLPPPAPVAIVNESFARKFWPAEGAVGKRFSLGDRFRMETSFEIVGVVKDVKYFGLREANEPMVYVPNWRLGAREGRSIVIRSFGDPEQLAGALRQQAREIDPSVPVLQVKTMAQQANSDIGKELIIATLCGFFGALALLLAAVGLYGVIAQMVSRRYREIGIRMALGARPGSVIALVMRETGFLVGLGALIGVPAAFALTRLVSGLLYGLKPQDPLTIAAAILVLLATTALATWIPARRAAAIDPMSALRWE